MPKKNPAAAEVKRALYRKGLTLTGWCRDKGYSPRTAMNVLERHAGGSTREPWGPKTRAILTELGQEIGQRLIP